jgi:HEAT repeat protein
LAGDGTTVDRIERLLADLNSNDLDHKLASLQALGELAQSVVDAVVEHLATEPEPVKYLVFERLGRFGTLAIVPLERLLQTSEDHATRVLAAAALLYLGSRVGMPTLLQAVRRSDPYLATAARALGASHVAEALPLIEQVLRETEVTVQTLSLVDCLLDTLKQLGGTPPDELRARFQTAEPSWLRRGANDLSPSRRPH